MSIYARINHILRYARINHILRLFTISMLAAATALANTGDEPGFVTLEESNLSCGAAIHSDQVLVIDNEGRKYDDSGLENRLELEAGAYSLASSEPILIPKFYTDGKTRQQYMVRDAQKAVADIGCDLLVILGIEFVEKQWEDPSAARIGTKRWITMGYALVLIGTRDR